MSAYLAYTTKDKSIKSVKLLHDGEIDSVGFYLIEYFNTIDKVEKLIRTTVDYIDEDCIEYESVSEYNKYHDSNEFIDDIDCMSWYYWFDSDKWLALKPNHESFKELEIILDEEY